MASVDLWVNACEVEIKAGQVCPKSSSVVVHTTSEVLTGIAQFPVFDAAEVAQVFSASFGVVVLFFLFGRGVGGVLRLIRRG